MQAGKLLFLGFLLFAKASEMHSGEKQLGQTDGQKCSTPGQTICFFKSMNSSTETQSACRIHLQATARCSDDLKKKASRSYRRQLCFWENFRSERLQRQIRKSSHCFQSRREFSSSFGCLPKQHQKISAVPEAKQSYRRAGGTLVSRHITGVG